MKKYQVVEFILNEYVDHPKERVVAEIEAMSKEEAAKIAKLRYPNLVVEIKEN